ncbi:hypothetical protein [Sulfitobacter sp. CW3]|uniref:hypothetical protein n=1 Tax=Sulfitobacter sp. CW3 TaxID=2861965 RepID=UPI001C5E641E|nr:hypothetical protein [Sulfitobacter sp. CW3]MBW4964108.1 hypothetical protein [Sulfitobacter sp. CW3]
MAHELTHCGTQPTFADVVIAHAAFPRTCGGIFSALQKISPNRTFNGVNSGKIQTALSSLSDLSPLQLALTAATNLRLCCLSKLLSQCLLLDDRRREGVALG